MFINNNDLESFIQGEEGDCIWTAESLFWPVVDWQREALVPRNNVCAKLSIQSDKYGYYGSARGTG
jgi:hypothetical protein